MESSRPTREWRCRGCGTLLGVVRSPWVQLKYKTAHFEVRGAVRTPCRRCGVVNETATEASTAAAS